VTADNFAEHKLSEAQAIQLRAAQLGYFENYPDPRLVANASQMRLCGFLLEMARNGSIGYREKIVQVSRIPFNWDATPFPTFTGISRDTVSSADPSDDPLAVGSRRYSYAQYFESRAPPKWLLTNLDY
jgi:hypothetical protein